MQGSIQIMGSIASALAGSETLHWNKGWKSARRKIAHQKQLKIGHVSLKIGHVSLKMELYVKDIQSWKDLQTIPGRILQILICEPLLWAM